MSKLISCLAKQIALFYFVFIGIKENDELPSKTTWENCKFNKRGGKLSTLRII